ncbi:MAG: hypothetical protein ACM3ZV_02120 [Bacillota bacterium]
MTSPPRASNRDGDDAPRRRGQLRPLRAAALLLAVAMVPFVAAGVAALLVRAAIGTARRS